MAFELKICHPQGSIQKVLEEHFQIDRYPHYKDCAATKQSPRKVVQSPCLEVFKTWLEKFLPEQE